MLASFNRGLYVTCRKVSNSFTTQCDDLPFPVSAISNPNDSLAGSTKKGTFCNVIKNSWVSRCDDKDDDEISSGEFDDEDDDKNSLDDLANDMKKEESDKSKAKSPKSFDMLMGTLSQGTVDAMDGLRVIVQKQLSLNTVVTHNYTVGAHGGQESTYQYGIIQAFGTFEDGNQIQLNSDADMNISGNATFTFSPSANLQCNFQSGGQGSMGAANLNITDSQSATQFTVNHEQGNNSFGISYMQALSKSIQLGGSGDYSPAAGVFKRKFGGTYDDEENLFAAMFGGAHFMYKCLYLRRVNPGRVNLSADLTCDNENNQVVTAAAEYTLKQSKLHMSLDTNAFVRSSIESTLSQGVRMTMAAEMNQAKEHYKFGLMLLMG